jgi:hypothetical protein
MKCFVERLRIVVVGAHHVTFRTWRSDDDGQSLTGFMEHSVVEIPVTRTHSAITDASFSQWSTRKVIVIVVLLL